MAVNLRSIDKINQSDRVVVYGYIRRTTNEYIPEAILQLCVIFYGNASNSYVWWITDKVLLQQIKNAAVCQKFRSPVFTMHGFKWYLQLWPNGDTKRQGKVLIFAVLPSMSPKIESIALHRKYFFLEGDLHHNYDYTMENKAKMHVITWPNKTLLFDDIQKYETLSIGVEIKIWNLYDEKGNDIKDEWLRYHGNRQVSSVEMQSLSNKMDRILQKLDEIAKRMNEKEKYNMGAKTKGLREWLKEIGIMQYFDAFVANGFDQMSAIALIEQEDLNEIGIIKIGHQLKMVDEIKKLKRKQASVAED